MFVRWEEDTSEFYIDPFGSLDVLDRCVRICNAAKCQKGV